MEPAFAPPFGIACLCVSKEHLLASDCSWEGEEEDEEEDEECLLLVTVRRREEFQDNFTSIPTRDIYQSLTYRS